MTFAYFEVTKRQTTKYTKYTKKQQNMQAMNDILYADEIFRMQGAVCEVYKSLGIGFLEAVYQEALELELSERKIPFKSQMGILIEYKGTPLKQMYRADLVCFDKIILELKSVKQILPEHEAQLQNYLRATGMRLGLLVNFNHFPGADIRRIVK